jgi:hypothetical protein
VSALKRWKQEEHEFKANWNIARLCLKNKQTKTNNNSGLA